MKLEKIYTKAGSAFGNATAEWASNNNLKFEEIQFDEGFDEDIKGLVVFNQNSDIERHLVELINRFDKSLKPIQRIDINGTLMVGVSNFSLWLERNGCQNVLFIGDDNLVKNEKLGRYFDALKVN